jgi:hypothetical protein
VDKLVLLAVGQLAVGQLASYGEVFNAISFRF